MQTVILALDIGTSSTRAILYDAESVREIPGAAFAIEHEPDQNESGKSTLNPEALVQEAVHCIARVLQDADGQTQVIGVGVSALWHSFIGVDSQGAAQTSALLWSDRRSAPQVEALRHAIDTDAYTQRTGCPLHCSYLPGRLLWLRETEPEIWNRCHRFLSPPEYLFSRFFGLERTTVSSSMASGTGLLNQAAGTWDAATLEFIPGLTPQSFSPVSDDPVSGLLPEFRAHFPLLADVPWFPALGDGACSNIGCGAVTPGTIALMIGTSGALRVAVTGEIPPVYPGLWRYQIDANRFLAGGALSNGGAVWAWLKKTLSLSDTPDDAIEEAIAALPPDGHRLAVLPFLNGERAPLWRDDATAAILGLRSSTTALEIARAHLEAVAYRFAAVREPLRAVSPYGRIIGTGAGLVASGTWAQIIADVLGEPIFVSEEKQASARGAALWARERLGLGAIEKAPPLDFIGERQPDNTKQDAYEEGRARHEAALARWSIA
ncbi:MAG: gluconokinase [Armatimonadota bacterium]